MWYCYKDMVCKSCKKTFKYSHDTITLAIGEVECPHCKTVNSLNEIINKERKITVEIISKKENDNEPSIVQEVKDDELDKVLETMQVGHKIDETIHRRLYSDDIANSLQQIKDTQKLIDIEQNETYFTHQSQSSENVIKKHIEKVCEKDVN